MLIYAGLMFFLITVSTMVLLNWVIPNKSQRRLQELAGPEGLRGRRPEGRCVGRPDAADLGRGERQGTQQRRQDDAEGTLAHPACA